MCQIILKPAGYTLRKDLLESTCWVNGDGMGLMFREPNGDIHVEKYLDKSGSNDADYINDFLKDYHDEEVFLHFRYKTVGPISMESCHPFKIHNEFDKPVWMMHNGTFSGYGDHTRVDSQALGEDIIGPVYNKFLKAGVGRPLEDDLFRKVAKEFIGGSSKVVLMDTGGHVIFNGKSFGTAGKYDGQSYHDSEADVEFWVSNTYSFDQGHRSTKTYSHTNYGRGGTTSGQAPFDPTHNYRSGQGSSCVIPSTFTPNSSETSKTTPPQTNTDGTASNTNGTSVSKKVEGYTLPAPTKRATYWEDVLGLHHIDDLMFLSWDDIGELVDTEPQNAKLLIKDLCDRIASIYYEKKK